MQAKGICDQAVRENQAANAIRNVHAALAHVSYHECKLGRIERCVAPVAARRACNGRNGGAAVEAPWGLTASVCGTDCSEDAAACESLEQALEKQSGADVLHVAGGERGGLRRTLLVDASARAMAHVYVAHGSDAHTGDVK